MNPGTTSCICSAVIAAGNFIGSSAAETEEDFEAFHRSDSEEFISIDVTSDNMQDFLTSDTTDVIDDEGNIVSVRNVNDKIIITKPDDAYQELPHGK